MRTFDASVCGSACVPPSLLLAQDMRTSEACVGYSSIVLPSSQDPRAEDMRTSDAGVNYASAPVPPLSQDPSAVGMRPSGTQASHGVRPMESSIVQPSSHDTLVEDMRTNDATACASFPVPLLPVGACS